LKTIELDGLYLITPNEDELPAICSEKAFTREDQVNELFQRGVSFIWLHNGKAGSTLYSNNRVITLAAVPVEVVDSNGAGDASLAGYIMGKYLGMEDIDCLKLAHTLSSQVLQVKGAVAKDLDQIKLLSLLSKYYPANE
jgi:pseudouridine kinase